MKPLPTDVIKPLPCMFCGEREPIIAACPNDGYMVACPTCSACGPSKSCERVACIEWNSVVVIVAARRKRVPL